MRVVRFILPAVVTSLSLLVAASPALAGRLIESGHDFDFHCGSAQNTECDFVKVALDYVRAGAPDPTRQVLVLDRGSVWVQAAINKAYGIAAVPMTVVDPRGPAFATLPIDTAHWSAIVVASDINCVGCDLNATPAGGAAQTPDSTAIYARSADIAAFFAAGGGIVAGSGAVDSGGFAGITFDAMNVPYYAFLGTTGAGPVAGPFALTSLGSALGLTDDDVNVPICAAMCTHNSFAPPPAGSRLQVAETDGSTGRPVTLVEDTDPPTATITSGPPAVSSSTTATFTFASSEDNSTFQCRLDGAAFAPCGSSHAISGLAIGRHELDVRAVDLVGNVQLLPTTYAWSVVAPAPPPTPQTPPTTTPAARTKATISALRETNATFRVGRSSTALTGRTAATRAKQGTVFSFRLDQPATVRIAIGSTARGRRVGRSCRADRPRRSKPRCTRTVIIDTLRRSAHAGLNEVAFSGRIRGKALNPGHYRAAFTAITSAGTNAPKTLRFTIVRR